MNKNNKDEIQWFSKKDINIPEFIEVYNLHGYVLPHAGTTFSGKIISHTLRFKPKKKFKNIIIFYLPASQLPDAQGEYHEYLVPQKSLEVIYPDKKFIGYNMLSKKNPNIDRFTLKNSLFVISADFSHFLNFNEAIEKENCSARSLMFRQFTTSCVDVVDDKRTFKFFLNKFNKLILDWVGRTRSPGDKGVGYLSFLLRTKINLKQRKPDGFFVTAYDLDMRARECLGDVENWNKELEKEKINLVVFNARTTSRLTDGNYLKVPVKYCQITYLFKKENKSFIRGWHSILGEAFYLSDVFLENTLEDGQWIDNMQEWNPKNNFFNLNNTFQKLHSKKMGLSNKINNSQIQTEYSLFTSEKIFKIVKNIKNIKIKQRKLSKKNIKDIGNNLKKNNKITKKQSFNDKFLNK